MNIIVELVLIGLVVSPFVAVMCMETAHAYSNHKARLACPYSSIEEEKAYRYVHHKREPRLVQRYRGRRNSI